MTDYSPDRFLIFLANHAAALHGRKLGIVGDYIGVTLHVRSVMTFALIYLWM